MTKADIEALLRKFGPEGKKAAAEIYDRIDTEKQELDTETRRKVRAFWLPVGVVLGVVAILAVQFFM